jgi:hypothetical protein
MAGMGNGPRGQLALQDAMVVHNADIDSVIIHSQYMVVRTVKGRESKNVIATRILVQVSAFY